MLIWTHVHSFTNLQTKKNEAEVDIRDLEDAQKESTNNIEQFQPELDSVSEEVEHLRSLAKRHKVCGSRKPRSLRIDPCTILNFRTTLVKLVKQ